MKKLFCSMLIFSLSFGLIFPSFAEEEKTYTTYQLEHRDVSLKEVQDVINRTVGSGTVDVARGEFLRKGIQSQVNSWLSSHTGAKVVGGVPFYGPRNLVVAYEYYLQCGDKICGSIYDVFPGKTSMDEIFDLFVKGKKCLEIYGCYFPQDYYAVYTKSGKIGHFGPATEEEQKDGYVVGPTIEPMLVPDAVPTSIRLAESIPEGKMKFFHGIYAIRGKDLKVISLNPRDKNLTVKELKKRLIGLVDFSMQSPTIPLMYERAKQRNPFTYIPEGQASKSELDEKRLNESPYKCIPISPDDPRYMQDGILLLPGMYYKPYCFGLPGRIPLFLGNYTVMNPELVDYLSGRALPLLGVQGYGISFYLNFPL